MASEKIARREMLRKQAAIVKQQNHETKGGGCYENWHHRLRCRSHSVKQELNSRSATRPTVFVDRTHSAVTVFIRYLELT